MITDVDDTVCCQSRRHDTFVARLSDNNYTAISIKCIDVEIQLNYPAAWVFVIYPANSIVMQTYKSWIEWGSAFRAPITIYTQEWKTIYCVLRLPEFQVEMELSV